MPETEPGPSDSEPDDNPTPASKNPDRPLVFRSKDLLQGRKEVWIEHGDDMYRLRVTSLGKLYLTK